MIVVEFAGITMLCLMPWPTPSRAASSVLVVAIVVLGARAGPTGHGHHDAGRASWAVAEAALDLKQFLPARYPQKPYGSYAELSLGPVEGLPTIACAPVPSLCRAVERPFGELAVEIDARDRRS